MEDASVEWQKYSSEWKEQQIELRNQLIEEDEFDFDMPDAEVKSTGVPLRYIGGVDLSFVKQSKTKACAALVVLEYPSLKIVHEIYEMVELTHPYIAGYLAFREVPHLAPLIERLRKTRPDIMPQIILVDGNGVLHYRGFGIASHLGVVCDIPCIGVAKKLLYVDGLTNEGVAETCRGRLNQAGDFVELMGHSGRTWGVALRSSADDPTPVYVSVGHRISLASATQLTILVSRTHIPEPIHRADLGSRNVVKQYESQLYTRRSRSAVSSGGNRSGYQAPRQTRAPLQGYSMPSASELASMAIQSAAAAAAADAAAAAVSASASTLPAFSPQQQQQPRKEGYTCPECWQMFRESKTLTAHKQETGHGCATCMQCQTFVSSTSGMKKHAKSTGFHYFSGDITPNRECRTSLVWAAHYAKQDNQAERERKQREQESKTRKGPTLPVHNLSTSVWSAPLPRTISTVTPPPVIGPRDLEEDTAFEKTQRMLVEQMRYTPKPIVVPINTAIRDSSSAPLVAPNSVLFSRSHALNSSHVVASSPSQAKELKRKVHTSDAPVSPSTPISSTASTPRRVSRML